MKVQCRDTAFDATRPREGHFCCRNCLFKWRAQHYDCTECAYSVVYIKDFVSGVRIGQGSLVRTYHNDCGRECLRCAPILLKAKNCNHHLEKTAGIGGCPQCKHSYVDWLNYVPPRYYWADSPGPTGVT